VAGKGGQGKIKERTRFGKRVGDGGRERVSKKVGTTVKKRISVQVKQDLSRVGVNGHGRQADLGKESTNTWEK